MKRYKTLTISITIILGLCLFVENNSIACSAFGIYKDNRIVVVKNLDWFCNYGFLVVNKRNVTKQAFLPAASYLLKWTSRYGSITFTQTGVGFTSGGMNEVGLVIEESWLGRTQYPDPDTLDISGEINPKYQWAYNGNNSLIAVYGRLYTWYAVTDSRSICPAGWHIPTVDEWKTLSKFLGESAAGNKLKEIGIVHWNSPNSGATNESGFTALPAGSRWAKFHEGKIYTQMGECVHYWTATEAIADTTCAWRCLIAALPDLQIGWAPKKIGWPVRCIKD